jgi:FdhD protein
MLASGRLSSEIVSKCARCGIPVIVSRAAPTSLAVEIADASGLTLVGFVRGDRMNIYTGTQRIRLKV